VIEGAAASLLRVFDFSGRMVYQQSNIGKSENISVSTWGSGVYFVVIQAGSNKIVSKVIKK